MAFTVWAARITCLVELTTGLALLWSPDLVSLLLLGASLPPPGAAVARCFGIALLSLSTACWPEAGEVRRNPMRGLTLYNVLVAVLLGSLGAVHEVAGPLLWPAVVIHAAFGLLLAVSLVTARTAGPGEA